MIELPAIIPLFPLPKVVLFPGVPLPLHIFEPRYRDMVRDLPSGENGVVGLVLLRGDWRKEYYRNPDVFAVGCAGRVMSVEPLPDGRYNILLHGLREFIITDEIRERRYRQARVRWRPLVSGTLDPGRRERLRLLLRQYTSGRRTEPALSVLNDESVSDELLVNFFSYAMEFDPLEKQSLLEAPSLSDRADRLCEIVEFALGAVTPIAPGSERCH